MLQTVWREEWKYFSSHESVSLCVSAVYQCDNDLLILFKIVLFKLLTMSTCHATVQSAYLYLTSETLIEILTQHCDGGERPSL